MYKTVSDWLSWNELTYCMYCVGSQDQLRSSEHAEYRKALFIQFLLTSLLNPQNGHPISPDVSSQNGKWLPISFGGEII